MKILVVITNYGTRNDHFLRRLLDEYVSMPWRVHVVVLSNVPKTFRGGVEVIVETPKGDPWSFAFAHKKILADRAEDYDLFIYSEDDTLVTARNIEAFLKVTECLPKDEIAGFIRSERGPDGQVYFSTVHGPFHWEPRSVVSHGPYTFAAFTNAHSACYLLTRHQLRRAIESSGFSVAPHKGRYDLSETAATDPYTQCGLKKLICISHIEDFVLPHLPNKYVGVLGLAAADCYRQWDTLKSIRDGKHPCTVLLNGETKLGQLRWSKCYYEPARPDILSLIPTEVRTLLSYGCGWGALEGELVKRGIHVTAVPLDSVIASCAEGRGLRVVYGDSDSTLMKLSGEQFDCIVLTNLLHLVPDPHSLIVSLARLAIPSGLLVASIPNISQLPVRWRRFTGRAGYESLGSYERSGVHVTSLRLIKNWFLGSGMPIEKLVSIFPDRIRFLANGLNGIGHSLLASEFLVLSRKI